MSGARLLTDAERAVLESIPLEIDCSLVRLYEGNCSGRTGRLRRLVLLASRNRAIALGNHVFLPDRCRGDLGTVVHELTHCGQYQAWGPLKYFARGFAAQARHLIYRTVRIGRNPYWYRVTPGKPFRAYGMEQQAQMIEDRFRARNQDQAVPSA
ncbi:MAG: hypothetical protein K0S19_1243 [Geminicoccaceae bacterium]|nr:hypothetical protein [Geminicoccaceae bacterium]